MLLLCGTPSHSTGVCGLFLPVTPHQSACAGGIKAQWSGSLDQKLMVAGSKPIIWGRGMRGSHCKTLYLKYGLASLVKDTISLLICCYQTLVCVVCCNSS